MAHQPSDANEEATLTALLRRLRNASNEEEVRIAWLRALEAALGIEFTAERGRRDLSYNNVVIEFKGPGKFRGRTSSTAFSEALNQRLLPYIRRTAEEERIPESDYIGIAIDSTHLAFAQVVDGSIVHQNLLPIGPRTFALVVKACRTSYRRAITAENLIEDFGHESKYGAPLLRALAQALAGTEQDTTNAKVRMLFNEWRTLYGQVADLSARALDDINGTIGLPAASNETEVSARLFVIHTFNSLLMKLLAAEIVAAHGLAPERTFADGLLGVAHEDELFRRLEHDIEKGRFFESINISGFVEEAIFSWYLNAGSKRKDRLQLAEAIKDVLGALSLYRTDTLSLNRSRDVLRDFYQNLVPEVLRKSLGEFYTPDWLVDFTCDRADVTDWIATKTLDPTCGSGSFLVEVIRRKRAAADARGMSAGETTKMLIESVWGFDLNPLAVQIARTNFLMAIADLLKKQPGTEIEIPVLMADAVYSPAPLPQRDDGVIEYRIGSNIADLKVELPAELALDRAALDRVLALMGEHVEHDAPYEKCAEQLTTRKLTTEKQARTWARPLKLTYERVLALHQKKWNGIWFRIVRNFFWSATAGRFELIVGNPPWVRWSRLPDAYRERAKPTCAQYDIFSSTPHHGGNELDISAMITYTTADKWLAENGTLAFVITQTHFQGPSSEGFRRFRINTADRLAPLRVDDMQGLKPFPEAANKTSVAVFRKTRGEPVYPVDYRVWRPKPGKARAIPIHMVLTEVLDTIEVDTREANPVGGAGTPWTVLPPGRYARMADIRGRSAGVHGRKGITADLNGVYFVPAEARNESNGLVRIRTRPEAGKRDIGRARRFWIEPDLLYPLVKGAADIDMCRISRKHKLFVVLPNRGITREALDEAAKRMNRSCPKTKRYLEAYEQQLRSRSTWRNRMPTAPFYAVYNVGPYTFAPYKVVWAEQSGKFKAAVATRRQTPAGRRPYVPDHKVFFVPFQNPGPAYFLCGLLAAELVTEFIESHTIAIQVGDIFKHMRLPAFDEEEAAHTNLANLVRRAHTTGDEQARGRLLNTIRKSAEAILMTGRS